LVDGGVHILPKALNVHAGAASERGHCCLSRHEHPLAKRDQLANGNAIACNDEGLPAV
jgi:hypothetical protein